ncbi:MAG: DUF1295 domain-containing protein [Anaerolineae bacterium]|nr:DUF1295 domain-containing protein [Anaerolineae bacterium]
MSLLAVIGIAFGVMLAYVTVLWLISIPLKNVSIVDIFWGLGFVAMAWTYWVVTDGFPARKALVVALVTIWGLRLAGYLLWRNGLTHEDFRYAKWRSEQPGSYWWRSYFSVFLLQGLLFWAISAPLFAAQFSPTPARLGVLDALGALFWAIGLFFEAVGDLQLARFKADPANKGKVLNTGLWRYTRHPNYFGDFMVWWGYGLIALGTFSLPGVVSLLAPALMSFLLLRVSGVTLLEKSLNEKPGYREYVEATSAFFPLPPKKTGRG